jgi:hypothetical protein
MMGDSVIGAPVTFRAQVLGGEGAELRVIVNGAVVATVPVTSADFVHDFPSGGDGAYRIEVGRGQAMEALTTPIWWSSGASPRVGVQSRDCTPLRVSGRISGPARVRNGKLPTVCEAGGGSLEGCSVAVRRRGRTLLRGRRELDPGQEVVTARLTRAGHRALGSRPRVVPVKLVFTASDGDGAVAKDVVRARLRLPAP